MNILDVYAFLLFLQGSVREQVLLLYFQLVEVIAEDTFNLSDWFQEEVKGLYVTIPNTSASRRKCR